MRKRLGVLLLGLLPFLVQAQEYNTKCLGVAAGYLFDTKNVEVEIFFHLPVAKHWRIVPAIQYSFAHKGVNVWGAKGDVHYLVPFGKERFSFYPLAGVVFQSWRGQSFGEDELFTTYNKFGINAGAGFEVTLPHRLSLHLEGKYVFMEKFHQPHLSLGLGYRF